MPEIEQICLQRPMLAPLLVAVLACASHYPFSPSASLPWNYCVLGAPVPSLKPVLQPLCGGAPAAAVAGGTEQPQREKAAQKHDDIDAHNDGFLATPPPLPQPCVTPTTCTVPLYSPLKPLFPPTYLMNESTIVMPCNAAEDNGGWSNATFFGQFGIADYGE